MDIYRVKKKVVLLIASILLLTSISLGATFYVESINVSDTPVGLSTDALDPNLKLGTFSCEVGTWYMGSTNGADNFDIAQVWGTPRLRINSSGYVGIGVASPASRLSILQGAADGAGTSAMGIGFQYDSTFTRAGIYADGITGWLGALHFATNPGANSHTLTPRMTIRDDKVGIGTTTPQTALHVVGTLTVSSGIVVAGSTMTVPDYVFDESYRLMPLDELQKYVEVNKHLPNLNLPEIQNS